MNEEIKIKKALYIVGIVITTFVLFCVGIFTLFCLVWPNKGNEGTIEIGLVLLCLFLLILIVIQLKKLSKLSNNIKNIDDTLIENQENKTLNFNESKIESTKKNGNITTFSILIGGLILLYFLYKIAHNLDIL